MLFRDKDKPMISKVLTTGSLVAVFFSIVGAVESDVYLASTQWLLVSVVLAVWGIYLLLEAEFRS